MALLARFKTAFDRWLDRSTKKLIGFWDFKPEVSQGESLMGRYYRREGSCHQCGQCCTNIHLVHGESAIESLEEFERLKLKNPEYAYFEVIDSTDYGLKFKCIHLQSDNNCGIYEDRPMFCRRYPTEEVLLKGAHLAEDCGYRFELLRTFNQVLVEQGGPSKQPIATISEDAIVSAPWDSIVRETENDIQDSDPR